MRTFFLTGLTGDDKSFLRVTTKLRQASCCRYNTQELRIWAVFPADTGRKLTVRKTFTRRPGRLLKVLCTFNLRPVSTGFWAPEFILCSFPTKSFILLFPYRLSFRCLQYTSGILYDFRHNPQFSNTQYKYFVGSFWREVIYNFL